MVNLSIIIPYWREPYLDKTITSLKDNAVTEIEVLAEEGSKGMRAAINEGLKKAKGEFIMKIDAHCAVAKGFDKVLTENCKENWLMVPRRYSLNEETWDRMGRPRDYHYLRFPGCDSSYGYSFQVTNWPKSNDLEIDDTMTYQGSGWVANKDYFMDHIGFYDDRPETYGTFAQDQQEVGLKYWLGGGEIKVNKRTWYAHLQKRGYHYQAGTFSRRHKKDEQRIKGDEWGTRHWINNEEPNMIRPFSWLIEKFNPPGWENWEERWKNGN